MSRSFSCTRPCKHLGHQLRAAESAWLSRRRASAVAPERRATDFQFSKESFRKPKLGTPANIIEVPVAHVSADGDGRELEGYGHLVHSPDDFCVENKTFEIVPWPVQGWRQLDPQTGDEAGTTEGPFEVHWQGDYFHGKNLAVATENNTYLDGLGCSDPGQARCEEPGYGASPAPDGEGDTESNYLYLWMSDYHPDGGQLFFPMLPEHIAEARFLLENHKALFPMRPEHVAEAHIAEADWTPPEFFVCLGKSSHGDDIKPTQMQGFRIPSGKGIYIHPGTWHNGIYVHRRHGPQRFFTRQGRVHARVSVSWNAEFDTTLKLCMT